MYQSTRRRLHTHIGFDTSRFGDMPFITVLHFPIRHCGVGRAMETAFTNPHGPFFLRIKHGRSLMLLLRTSATEVTSSGRRARYGGCLYQPPRPFFLRVEHERSLMLHNVRLRRRIHLHAILLHSNLAPHPRYYQMKIEFFLVKAHGGLWP